MSTPLGNVVFMKDEQQFPRPDAPGRVAHLMDEPGLAAAWERIVNTNRETAQTIELLLDYREDRETEVAGEHAFVKAADARDANRDATLLLGMAEQTATAVLNQAQFIHQDFPKLWKAFRSGAVDLAKLRKTADAAGPLADREDLLAILDDELVDVAAGKTPNELATWLTRRIPNLDIELFNETAAEAKDRRFVRFDHRWDGMSLVEILMTTPEAKAIQKKLNAVARAMNRPQPRDYDDMPHPAAAAGIGEDTPVDHDARYQSHDPEYIDNDLDDRTLRQREVDLLSAWLRDGHCYTTPISAKICVMVPEETLTGESDEPATGADRSCIIPAAEIRKLAADPQAEHEWYIATSCKNTTRADRDILSVVYNGRFAPERLRDAIIFRDGICQATGCTTGAEHCDLDHQIPYERAGPTTGSNLWALCRRHHKLKSHGYLPPPNGDPPQTEAPHHKAA